MGNLQLSRNREFKSVLPFPGSNGSGRRKGSRCSSKIRNKTAPLSTEDSVGDFSGAGSVSAESVSSKQILSLDIAVKSSSLEVPSITVVSDANTKTSSPAVPEIESSRNVHHLTNAQLKEKPKLFIGKATEEFDFAYTESQLRIEQMVGCSYECSQVTEHLFVGDYLVAEDWDMLCDHGITRIVNCSAAVVDNVYQEEREMQYMGLRMVDGKQDDIFWFLCEVLHFIADGVAKNEKTLLHCEKGISRSCSFAICYIMWAQGVPWKTAFDFVKERRASCNPNTAFCCHMLEVDQLLQRGTGMAAVFFRCAYHLPHDPHTPVLKLCRHPASRRLLLPHADMLDTRGVFVLVPLLQPTAPESSSSSSSSSSVGTSLPRSTAAGDESPLKTDANDDHKNDCGGGSDANSDAGEVVNQQAVTKARAAGAEDSDQETIFVWRGAETTKSTAKVAVKKAMALRGVIVSPDCKIVKIKQDHEPPAFWALLAQCGRALLKADSSASEVAMEGKFEDFFDHRPDAPDEEFDSISTPQEVIRDRSRSRSSHSLSDHSVDSDNHSVKNSKNSTQGNRDIPKIAAPLSSNSLKESKEARVLLCSRADADRSTQLLMLKQERSGMTDSSQGSDTEGEPHIDKDKEVESKCEEEKETNKDKSNDSDKSLRSNVEVTTTTGAERAAETQEHSALVLAVESLVPPQPIEDRPSNHSSRVASRGVSRANSNTSCGAGSGCISPVPSVSRSNSNMYKDLVDSFPRPLPSPEDDCCESENEDADVVEVKGGKINKAARDVVTAMPRAARQTKPVAPAAQRPPVLRLDSSQISSASLPIGMLATQISERQQAEADALKSQSCKTGASSLSLAIAPSAARAISPISISALPSSDDKLTTLLDSRTASTSIALTRDSSAGSALKSDPAADADATHLVKAGMGFPVLDLEQEVAQNRMVEISDAGKISADAGDSPRVLSKPSTPTLSTGRGSFNNRKQQPPPLLVLSTGQGQGQHSGSNSGVASHSVTQRSGRSVASDVSLPRGPTPVEDLVAHGSSPAPDTKFLSSRDSSLRSLLSGGGSLVFGGPVLPELTKPFLFQAVPYDEKASRRVNSSRGSGRGGSRRAPAVAFMWQAMGVYDDSDLEDTSIYLLVSPGKQATHFLWVGQCCDLSCMGILLSSSPASLSADMLEDEDVVDALKDWSSAVRSGEMRFENAIGRAVLREGAIVPVLQGEETEEFWDAFEAGT